MPTEQNATKLNLPLILETDSRIMGINTSIVSFWPSLYPEEPSGTGDRPNTHMEFIKAKEIIKEENLPLSKKQQAINFDSRNYIKLHWRRNAHIKVLSNKNRFYHKSLTPRRYIEPFKDVIKDFYRYMYSLSKYKPLINFDAKFISVMNLTPVFNYSYKRTDIVLQKESVQDAMLCIEPAPKTKLIIRLVEQLEQSLQMHLKLIPITVSRDRFIFYSLE